jgi:hypothetical protein
MSEISNKTFLAAGETYVAACGTVMVKGASGDQLLFATLHGPTRMTDAEKLADLLNAYPEDLIPALIAALRVVKAYEPGYPVPTKWPRVLSHVRAALAPFERLRHANTHR